MIPPRALDVSLGKWWVGWPIPYHILNFSNVGGVDGLTACFVVQKEACRKCVFDPGIDVFADDKEEVVYILVYYFVDNYHLYPCAGQHAKYSNLFLNELTDILILPVVFSCLVVIDVRLAL